MDQHFDGPFDDRFQIPEFNVRIIRLYSQTSNLVVYPEENLIVYASDREVFLWNYKVSSSSRQNNS